jgi:protein-S-isoprenylcysteine O-methyltransferase Ste14
MVYTVDPTLPQVLAFLAWLALAVAFVLRPRSASGAGARRDVRSRFGLALQAVAFGLGFGVHRPFEPHPGAVESVACWAGVVLAWGSVWLAVASVRVLGRQWSLDARVVEGHRLVREGPYRHVRHPIYLAMLGLCLGTALNLMSWAAIPVALVVYLAGTRLRTRAEEGLLLRQFGEEYERYAAEVPALVPWRFGRRSPSASGRG